MREPSSTLQCTCPSVSQLGGLTVTDPTPGPASGFGYGSGRLFSYHEHVICTGLTTVKARTPVQWFLIIFPGCHLFMKTEPLPWFDYQESHPTGWTEAKGTVWPEELQRDGAKPRASGQVTLGHSQEQLKSFLYPFSHLGTGFPLSTKVSHDLKSL